MFKHGYNKHQHNDIRNAMRELGKILIELGKLLPAKRKLKDFFRNVSRYDVFTGKMKTPSIALILGGSSQKCCGVVKATAIQLSDSSSLITLRWNVKILGKF